MQQHRGGDGKGRVERRDDEGGQRVEGGGGADVDEGEQEADDGRQPDGVQRERCFGLHLRLNVSRLGGG